MRSSSSTCKSRPTARRADPRPDRRERCESDCSSHFRPAVVVRVDVLEFETGLLQVGAIDTSPNARSSRHSLARRRHGIVNTSKHDVPGDRVKLQAAASGQKREAVLDLPLDSLRDPPSKARNRRSKRNSFRWCPRSRAPCRSLVGRFAQSSAELLEEQGRAVGRPKSSNVSTFGTSTPSLKRSTVKTTGTRPAARSRSAARRSSAGLSPQIATAGRPACRELLSHEPGVFNADTEAERCAWPAVG